MAVMLFLKYLGLYISSAKKLKSIS